MKRFLSSLLLFGTGILLAAPQVVAQTTSPTPKKSAKPAEKKAASKAKAAKPKDAAGDDEEKEPDITGTNSVDFQCELGNKLTIYENAADDRHIALKWNKRLHRLRRVDTTTGAHRFENNRYGLVWIGIPAKGMLLDSKKGRQLANDCKNAEQMQQKTVVTGAPGILSAPAATVPSAPATHSSAEKPPGELVK